MSQGEIFTDPFKRKKNNSGNLRDQSPLKTWGYTSDPEHPVFRQNRQNQTTGTPDAMSTGGLDTSGINIPMVSRDTNPLGVPDLDLPLGVEIESSPATSSIIPGMEPDDVFEIPRPGKIPDLREGKTPVGSPPTVFMPWTRDIEDLTGDNDYDPYKQFDIFKQEDRLDPTKLPTQGIEIIKSGTQLKPSKDVPVSIPEFITGPKKSVTSVTTPPESSVKSFETVKPYEQIFNPAGIFGVEIETPSKPPDSPLTKEVTQAYINLLQGKSPAMEQNLRMAESVLAKLASQGEQAAARKAAQMGLKAGEPGYNALMEQGKQGLLSQGSQILSSLAAQNLAGTERAVTGAGQYGYGQQKLGLGYDQLGAQTGVQKVNQALQALGYSDLFSEGQVGAMKGNVGDLLGISDAPTWTQAPATYIQNKVQEFKDMGYDDATAQQKAREAIELEDPNLWLQKMLEEIDFGNVNTVG